MRIFKYNLNNFYNGIYQLNIPFENFEVLTVKMQKENVQLWILVKDEGSVLNNQIEIGVFFTGQIIPENVQNNFKYIDTVLSFKDELVSHYFYKVDNFIEIKEEMTLLT